MAFEAPPQNCHRFDIVVVGGGIAGAMAAIAARTPHNRVLIVEPSNVLGGQGTAGGVAGFCGDTARVNAPFAELIARLTRHELIEPYRPNDDRRAYDLEWCAFILQEMVVARGIDVLLHTRVIAAQAEDGRVTELTAATAGGLCTIVPRFVIDASGACVVPFLTGFPVLHEGVNRQLPMSLYFTLWNTGRKVTPILPEGCPRWRNDSEIPMTSLHRFPSGKVEVKMKVVGFDAADGWSRSAAEIFARRQMHALIYYLQTVGYRGRMLDTHVLASVSRGIGVREERRIVGEHVLTEAEVRRAAIFPDAIAVNTYHIDFHWPDRMQREGTGIADMLDPHHLPLGMMIPKGAKNILVPGRGASSDQTAMSAFRVMAVVAQLGFAAGHAARQCVADGSDLTNIDIDRLQTAIETGGQSLDLSHYGEYLRCDLFVHEPLFEIGGGGVQGDCSSPVLVALTNACFLARWRNGATVDAELWESERREKQWSKPQPSAANDNPGAEMVMADKRALPRHVMLDDGTWASTDPVKRPGKRGGIAVAFSRDRGSTWGRAYEIDTAGLGVTEVAAVATRTGLAMLYIAEGGRLMFWHGSIERIMAGTPVAASVGPDAPPDPIYETQDSTA